jgi:hypothetical protein
MMGVEMGWMVGGGGGGVGEVGEEEARVVGVDEVSEMGMGWWWAAAALGGERSGEGGRADMLDGWDGVWELEWGMDLDRGSSVQRGSKCRPAVSL